MVQAVVLREVSKPLELCDLELSGPRRGEVRLHIATSGVCHSDLSVATGTLKSPLPVVLGHEAAGVVHEAGEGVESPLPGDRGVVETAWSLLGPGGLAVVVGMPAIRERVSLRVGGFCQEKRIAGCVYGSAHAHHDIPRLIEFYRSGELRLDPLVSREIPLARVQQSMDALARGEGVRSVIVNDR